MKKFNLAALLTCLSLGASVFSAQAIAAPQDGVKQMNFESKYQRKCTPVKYTPKNAACNKEKMSAQYFTSAVTTAKSALTDLSGGTKTIEAVKALLAQGVDATAIALALGEDRGYDRFQVEYYLKEAGYDINNPVKKYTTKHKDKKGHHFATNGGNTVDSDGHTVSCVKA